MNSPWPTVALGEIIEQRKEFITIDDLATYKRCRVQLHAQGVVLRDELEGARIKTKSQQVCHTDEFLVAEIDAKVGGFGIVPPELEGAIVSSHYFLFVIDQTRLDKRFLDYFIRTPDFQDQVNARGSTNYAAIRPHHVLAYEIPLPPLTEQRRIVARIETLAAKVEAARELREEATTEVAALFTSAADTIFEPKSNWRIAKVGDFCEKPQYGYTESATRQPIGPRFLRITDIQNGKVDWGAVPFCNCPNPEKYLLKENDILFARTGGTTGKSYLVKECPRAVFASYLIRLRVEKWVTPDYLYCYFQSPSYWKQVVDNKKGTGRPNVNGRKLAEIEVPIPPLPEQHRIVAHLDALQARLAQVQQHQAATQARMEALLPSILDKAFKGTL